MWYGPASGWGRIGQAEGTALHLAGKMTVTACALIAGGLLLLPSTDARAQGASQVSACDEAVGLSVLPTPVAPWTGMPLRVMFVAEKRLSGQLPLVGPNGAVAAQS